MGRIEQANGGTLFLDEIAEMTPHDAGQVPARAGAEREFQRVGGTRTIEADVRLIAATNRDLVGRDRPRRVARRPLLPAQRLPDPSAPLRERVADILPLAELFLEDIGKTMARPAGGISQDAIDWLLAYRWPGNVRELRNTIERALLLCDGGLITRDHLPASVAPPGRAMASEGCMPIRRPRWRTDLAPTVPRRMT